MKASSQRVRWSIIANELLLSAHAELRLFFVYRLTDYFDRTLNYVTTLPALRAYSDSTHGLAHSPFLRREFNTSVLELCQHLFVPYSR